MEVVVLVVVLVLVVVVVRGVGWGVKITLSVYSAFPTILSILQFWLEKK